MTLGVPETGWRNLIRFVRAVRGGIQQECSVVQGNVTGAHGMARVILLLQFVFAMLGTEILGQEGEESHATGQFYSQVTHQLGAGLSFPYCCPDDGKTLRLVTVWRSGG